jgi:hypothetical protein
MRVRITVLSVCLLMATWLATGVLLLRSADTDRPHGSLFPPAPSSRVHP